MTRTHTHPNNIHPTTHSPSSSMERPPGRRQSARGMHSPGGFVLGLFNHWPLSNALAPSLQLRVVVRDVHAHAPKRHTQRFLQHNVSPKQTHAARGQGHLTHVRA